MNFDAIVIGAGHNGLASAIHLAAKGWKVAVFERNKVAGGAVQTREATLPGFHPARAIVRYDKTLALSFVMPLQPAPTEALPPPSDPPRQLEKTPAPR